ncbi:MAG TPA: hypothetical protein VD902_15235 [Symbiobacteriaceae bacterium]|nr:hypothetical protein [Symbiobacteriaceae bacterium]
MHFPWQVPQSRQVQVMPVFRAPMRQVPLLETATGGFPVPESISPQQFPPAVRESIMRLLQGPPKPAVSLAVMDQTQSSMIAPDLPFRADV